MQTLLLCMCTSPLAKAWFLKTPRPRQLQRNSPHYTPVSPAPLQNKAQIAADLLKDSTCFNQIRCLGSHKSHLNTDSFCVFRDVETFITELNLMRWKKERANEWPKWCQRFYPDSLCFVMIKSDFLMCSTVPNWQKSDNCIFSIFSILYIFYF